MDRDSIKALIKEVAGPNTLIVDHEKWVSLRCWFAPYNRGHSNGRDTNPSAGISIKPDERSIYNCQTCKIKGTLPYILERLADMTGDSYQELIGDIDGQEFFGGKLKPWGEVAREEKRMPEPLDPEVILELYDTAYDHWYVRDEREIDEETAEFIDLRVDPKDSAGAERILFPVYSHKGQFYGFTGRAVDNKVYPPIRDYHGLPKASLLLGSHLVPEDAKYVVVVEGLFDFARLVQYRQPAVAYMSSGLTEEQVQVLIDIDLPVYFFRDNDNAGEDAQKKLVKETSLCRHVPVMVIEYPKRLVRTVSGDLRPVKDPDELTEGEVATMIKDALLLVS